MGKRKRTVWLVMHYEIMGRPDAPEVDSLQFHVSSSLKKAEAYIRSVWVNAHSWWQVHPHVVDTADFEEGEEVHYYSHRGTKLRTAPTKRAIIAFRRYSARHPECYPTQPPKSK
jgi:hypothetical protein